jgi:uncharacterized integral membrane protein
MTEPSIIVILLATTACGLLLGVLVGVVIVHWQGRQGRIRRRLDC